MNQLNRISLGISATILPLSVSSCLSIQLSTLARLAG